MAVNPSRSRTGARTARSVPGRQFDRSATTEPAHQKSTEADCLDSLPPRREKAPGALPARVSGALLAQRHAGKSPNQRLRAPWKGARALVRVRLGRRLPEVLVFPRTRRPCWPRYRRITASGGAIVMPEAYSNKRARARFLRVTPVVAGRNASNGPSRSRISS